MSSRFSTGVRQRSRQRSMPVLSTAATIVLLLAVFALAVRWFREKPDTNEQETSLLPASTVDILTPVPVSPISTPSTATEAILKAVSDQGGSGLLTRGEKDGHFYLSLTASLPEIDRNVLEYKLWLVRKVPYDFFSPGILVTDEAGAFVLEWDAPPGEMYRDYSDVVITREVIGGDPGPSIHVVEGVFE